jgi:hypothetical protein
MRRRNGGCRDQPRMKIARVIENDATAIVNEISRDLIA